MTTLELIINAVFAVLGWVLILRFFMTGDKTYIVLAISCPTVQACIYSIFFQNHGDKREVTHARITRLEREGSSKPVGKCS